MEDTAWFGHLSANLMAANYLVIEMLKELPAEEAWPLLIAHRNELEAREKE